MKHKKRHILIYALIFLTIVYLAGKLYNPEPVVTNIREPAVAGMFYPNDAEEINRLLNGFEVDAKTQNIVGIIAPHAGYQYSGQTASHAYSLLNSDFKKVILIGPSHYTGFSGVSIPDYTHYETPLGVIAVSAEAAQLNDKLTKAGLSGTADHTKEHSLEVQLPFLQYKLNEFELIPILIGSSTEYSDLTKIADMIAEYIDSETLMVTSSDFTHYGSRFGYLPFIDNIEANIAQLAGLAAEPILAIDSEKFNSHCTESKDTICGRLPIVIMLELMRGSDVELMHYDTSGRITGDFKNSVSYMSFVFTKGSISDANQKYLLTLARDTLEQYVKTGKKSSPDEIPPELLEEKGCFVTLEKNHNLRGCIGHILPQESLYECVIENAVNAAVNDGRFQKVTEDELDDIEVEVSVLSVPKKLEFTSGEDLKSQLRPGIDGVILRKGFYQSTYLPQVWDSLADKEQFLGKLCAKAGLQSDCWTDTTTEVHVYQAFVFQE